MTSCQNQTSLCIEFILGFAVILLPLPIFTSLLNRRSLVN